MSTSPIFSPLAAILPASPESSFAASYLGNRNTMRGPISVRRRPNLAQGTALEVLGHAIEYLVDSRVVDPSGGRVEYNREAVELLSKLSREIFADCAPIVPAGARLRRWLSGQKAA